MKKKALSIISLVCMAFTALGLSAQTTDPISLQVGYIDPTKELGTHKSPNMPPTVYLDGYILFFDTPCDGCTLNIVDSNDVVVYTLVIPTGTTSWVLPSTLSGDYIIEIIRDNYCFWGLIEL